jgi:YesN/AraC family two-component response regulator
VLAYIAANYRADLTLEEVAGQVHLCRSECSRMFRKYMKLSLFEYINEYRIKKSLDYLCDDSCSIGEIAELSGFSDPNYYAKVFQRYMHLSPSGYRKRKGVKKPDQERT